MFQKQSNAQVGEQKLKIVVAAVAVLGEPYTSKSTHFSFLDTFDQDIKISPTEVIF